MTNINGRSGGPGPLPTQGRTTNQPDLPNATTTNAADDDALYSPISYSALANDEATFTGTVKSGRSTTATANGAAANNASLTNAARTARQESLLPTVVADNVTTTSAMLADPSKLAFGGATSLGLAKRAADSLGEKETAKRLAESLGTAKALGDKGNARAGILTNGFSAASNTITAVRTGDMRSAARAGGDSLNAAGSAYDTLSQKNPAIANHWVVGSRYFAAASVVSVGRAAVDTSITAAKTVANPTKENAHNLANDAGRLAGATGAASFTVTAAKNAAAGAIAKNTGEEFAVAAAKVLPKAVDTAVGVAVKRAPLLFAAADVARVARVSSDNEKHPLKTTLAWVAVGGSAVATVGMLTANPVLIAAGGAVSLAAGTASDVLNR